MIYLQWEASVYEEENDPESIDLHSPNFVNDPELLDLQRPGAIRRAMRIAMIFFIFIFFAMVLRLSHVPAGRTISS